MDLKRQGIVTLTQDTTLVKETSAAAKSSKFANLFPKLNE